MLPSTISRAQIATWKVAATVHRKAIVLATSGGGAAAAKVSPTSLAANMTMKKLLVRTTARPITTFQSTNPPGWRSHSLRA